jgi:hypothetical protein
MPSLAPFGQAFSEENIFLTKVLYQLSSFRPIPLTNMAAMGNVKKIFSSENA